MKSLKLLCTVLVGCAGLVIGVSALHGEDWPMWRHDAERSGASSTALPATLHRQWSLQLPPLKPAWPEDERLQFDANYAPIVVGEQMFVASSHDDAVRAYDLRTGREQWCFQADGPIRFAPLAWQGHLYFGADDGCCYCLDPVSGTLKWKFNGAPSNRLCIGNERLVSVWPMRSSPVIVDELLYITSGVWPFEGTMLYALDPETGQQQDVFDVRDESPQGYIVASGTRLYLPCGRSTAYCFDIAQRDRVRVRYDARGTSDYHVAVVGRHLFHGDKIVDVDESKTVPLAARRPVMKSGQIFFADQGAAKAYDLRNQIRVQAVDRRGEAIEIETPRPLWEYHATPVTEVHLAAGPRVYAHHEQTVFALEAAEDETAPPRVVWNADIEGHAAAMVAANGRLLVVTREGGIHCFAGDAVEQPAELIASPVNVAAEQTSRAESVANDDDPATTSPLTATPSLQDGYCLVLGLGDGKVVDRLLRESDYHVIVVDADASKVSQLRQRMLGQGDYGPRVVALAAEPLSLNVPPYMASLITTGDLGSSGFTQTDRFVAHCFAALRPYGGALMLPLNSEQHDALQDAVARVDLAGAKLLTVDKYAALLRPEGLPGSGDWTHEYGDTANSLMSQDKLVKAPLGVLWFGGPSADGSLYYDRHDWGPSMVVLNGRMFIQGPQKFAAIDIYTGRILWQMKLQDGISPGRRSNWDASGFHFAAVEDAVYLALPDKCLMLDPKSGSIVQQFQFESPDEYWGRIRIWKDLLIVPVFSQPEGESSAQPLRLAVLNRLNGTQVWSKESAAGFPLMAVADDRLFCYEGKLAGLYRGDSAERRGGVPVPEGETRQIRAFDVSTGQELWSKYALEPVSWISFSAEHDVAVFSNREGIRAADGTTGETLWTKSSTGEGFRGHPENYWDKVILWKDQLLDQRGPGKAYNLKTGLPVTHVNPVTGTEVDWEFTKIGHHCNYAIASEFLMTFRADAAGFCDLATGETSRLNGFRPGCRNSLIPAGGVLNAPNFGHGCVCGYSLFTSLALIHVPEADMWTYGTFTADDEPIQQIGINLNAPGDRRDEQGTLWVDYPSIGGPSPKVTCDVSGADLRLFRLHPREFASSTLPWVASSGMEGLETLTLMLQADEEHPRNPAVAPAEGDVVGSGALASQGAAGEQTTYTVPTYTVRLHFAEPTATEVGQRVFDVMIQGEPCLEALDIVAEARQPHVQVVKEFTGIATKSGVLKLEFRAHAGLPLLCGLEVVAEK